MEFGLTSYMSPQAVITVLLSSSNIQPGCLDMPVFYRTNPYFRPCRRNSQFLNSVQVFPLGNCFVFSYVYKSLSLFETLNAGHIIPDIDEIHGPGSFLVVLIGFEQFFM